MFTRIVTPNSDEAKALGWDISEPVEAIQAGAFLATSDKPDVRTDLWAPFADGLYRFALGDAQVRSLEMGMPLHRTTSTGDRYQLGIGGIYRSIAAGRALTANGAPNWAAVTALDPDAADFSSIAVRRVVELGLTGGGEGVVNERKVTVDSYRAADLVHDHLANRPLAEMWSYAFAILGAHIFGRTPSADGR
jgi:hypothetical protein